MPFILWIAVCWLLNPYKFIYPFLLNTVTLTELTVFYCKTLPGFTASS